MDNSTFPNNTTSHFSEADPISFFNSSEDYVFANVTETAISPRELVFEYDGDEFDTVNETYALVNGIYLENGTIGNDTLDGRRYVPSAIPDYLTTTKPTEETKGNDGKQGFIFLFGLCGIIILIGLLLKFFNKGKDQEEDEEHQNLKANENPNEKFSKM
ncbi:Oidioi.mRNA.OKI2018_I69.PAR.g12074.t1.cds [Oikopleura dioica]|uniref:Oidioi.mRNA.OKI2018_I69.PAR.g12074.t1.cds n=1 Tax=Oikopleura dioica TaxID=34765 RepID=A0ABN7RYM4_OIKDI|nr:Oidioi.mRNA.OKI2018_I69.PAR.g12074.t1.cds [Oikopleura dioica]